MKSRSAAALFLLATLLWAKGDLVVVEVQGGALTTPLKITDPKIQDFNIWAGPGVNGATTKDAKGFIIDWQAGVAAHLPAGLQHYEISFYEGCRIPNDWCRAEKPSLAYVVFYDYDPASQRGFVYLPGKGEPWYAMNVRSIWHGDDAEGHWFQASDSWEGFVRPIIANALSRNR